MDTEQDPHALAAVITAFTGYCHREEVPAILIHADHIAPNVRRSVATHLFINPALGAAEQQEVLAALVRLAADPAPELRTVMAAHLTDSHLDARIEAAAGLARRGDERGLAVLHAVRSAIRNRRSPGAGRLGDLHDMLTAQPWARSRRRNTWDGVRSGAGCTGGAGAVPGPAPVSGSFPPASPVAR
ncbi:hypothetical protein [Kitasatospora purpeofusca]|uniref:hypothetical protein n=1 Tax=Kitasatospora purpeofusca TaxID=67352 RepID=UPI0035DE6BF2